MSCQKVISCTFEGRLDRKLRIHAATIPKIVNNGPPYLADIYPMKNALESADWHFICTGAPQPTS